MTWVMKKRIHEVELFMKYPHEVQKEVLSKLIATAKHTEFGKKYDFESIKALKDFKARVPLANYETLFPYIERLMKGEQKILWPSEIKWFAKSSGTTAARSKFIPVSQEALDDCHYKGGKDMISLYVNNYPETKLFRGKSLSIGGSSQVNELDFNQSSHYGDISAVIIQNLPMWAQLARTPSLEVALMSEWEQKIEKMAQETLHENVVSMAGVPTWTIVLLQRILELSGKSHILEVWPNLEIFFHGAVAFGPYKKLFGELIPSSKMRYMETYNASEGFFGIQDQRESEDLLLMLDYGIFYEFIPMGEWDKEDPLVIPLEEVELGLNYAMLISTNAGLWRYKIGDTVTFTSLLPYRVRISGRTKHFINAFGEEVIVENAEKSISMACDATGALIANFTAAPVYFDEEGNKGAHEWIIEFKQQPFDKDEFVRLLDQSLREINSDYDAKRYKDLALTLPKVHFAPEGLFERWMKSRGKLGGQNKVPRLSNDRGYIEEILALI